MPLRSVLPILAALAAYAAATLPSSTAPALPPGTSPAPAVTPGAPALPPGPAPAPEPAPEVPLPPPGAPPAPDLQPTDPPIKPPPGPDEKPPEEAAVIHEAHKEYRTRHCAHWLRWSGGIAGAAQARADELAKACKLRPGDTKYGENLWSGTSGKWTPQKVVDSWYAEGKRYNYKRPGHSKGTARFTQLVWVGSRRYGCATSTCKKTDFWVCFYDPPGNVDGEFERNVLSPDKCKE